MVQQLIVEVCGGQAVVTDTLDVISTGDVTVTALTREVEVRDSGYLLTLDIGD